MADPTQPARDFVKSMVSSVVPDNSPLALSNDDTLTPEARAKLEEANKKEAEAAVLKSEATLETDRQPAQGVEFVPSPLVQAPQAGQIQPNTNLSVNPQIKQGFQEERSAYQDQVPALEQNMQLGQQQAQALSIPGQAELEAEKRAQEIQDSMKKAQEERAAMKIEPKSYFEGKSTWQKIIGGVGLFLSSFSEQGHKTAMAAIDSEINRDIERQKAAMDSKDKDIANKQTSYKYYYDKFKDEKTARILAKREAMEAVKFRAEHIANVTTSKTAAAKALGGAGKAQAEIDQLNKDAEIRMAKIGNKSGLGGLSGEQQKRYDLANEGMLAAREMQGALAKGGNTFSIVGDNDFTFARKRFVEALGRMNSGGVIGDDEVKNFESMLPTAKDSPAMQKKKMAYAVYQMGARLKTLGVDPSADKKQFGFKAN